MSLTTLVLLLINICVILTICMGDTVLQLNVNRPFNDVSENFVSFAVKPEDLYKALDGPYRKTLTKMAIMLGDSYVKLIGDYFFTSNTDTKLRNPSRTVWKGFNRWTTAVNWTMIIPVPYKPDNWDPLLSLKILNSSYSVGITDCIWQLGTDFDTTRAEDYILDLKTFNIMVESFHPFVDDWKIMGTDISEGSNSAETRRYVELSKDLNTAFGWDQTTNNIATISMNSYINGNDPALKILLSKKVPIWLNFHHKHKISLRSRENNVIDALHWAEVLGEAASTGFNAIFKTFSLNELETPTLSFYVTVLFKKLMGSRVFPARSLNVFTRVNNLYTHCANMVSGGIVFMVVNSNDNKLPITLRSVTKIASSEIWQYTLTFQNGNAMLNGEKLTLNSTLSPKIYQKNVVKPVQLSTPAMSVSFWVLPHANLDYCHYTEIKVGALGKTSRDKIFEKRYTTADKLLQKLIQESSLTQNGLLRMSTRKRRYAKKRDIKNKNTLDNIKENPRNETALLNRHSRSVNNYFGSFFSTKDDKKIGAIKKITEIRKQKKKKNSNIGVKTFDEETYFKDISEPEQQEYTPFPEGDVHIKHISNINGEDIEEDQTKDNVHSKMDLKNVEPTNEMKPLRILHSDFYQSLPKNIFDHTPNTEVDSVGNTMNLFSFPETYSKKTVYFSKRTNSNNNENVDQKFKSVDVDSGKYRMSRLLSKDFHHAQKGLSNLFLTDPKRSKYHNNYGIKNSSVKEMERIKQINHNSDVNKYFIEKDEIESNVKPDLTEKKSSQYDEIPWWNLSSLRQKRSTKLQFPDDDWRTNMIYKDEEKMPLPEQNKNITANQLNNVIRICSNNTMPIEFISTIRNKVSTVITNLTRHVSKLYEALIKNRI